MVRTAVQTLVALSLALLAAVPAAGAQQAGRGHRIGFLRFGEPPPTYIEGFRQGLRELGYLEGQNTTIEYGLARIRVDQVIQ